VTFSKAGTSPKALGAIIVRRYAKGGGSGIRRVRRHGRRVRAWEDSAAIADAPGSTVL
jgi:hypothetical protein